MNNEAKRLLNNGKKEEMLFGDMDLPPDPRDNLGIGENRD